MRRNHCEYTCLTTQSLDTTHTPPGMRGRGSPALKCLRRGLISQLLTRMDGGASCSCVQLPVGSGCTDHCHQQLALTDSDWVGDSCFLSTNLTARMRGRHAEPEQLRARHLRQIRADNRGASRSSKCLTRQLRMRPSRL